MKLTAAAPGATVDVETVQARDVAIRDCLRNGPASFDEVLAAMPHEAGLSDEQRRLATNNCLQRLRLRKQIDTDGRLWRLLR